MRHQLDEKFYEGYIVEQAIASSTTERKKLLVSVNIFKKEVKFKVTEGYKERKKEFNFTDFSLAIEKYNEIERK